MSQTKSICKGKLQENGKMYCKLCLKTWDPNDPKIRCTNYMTAIGSGHQTKRSNF